MANLNRGELRTEILARLAERVGFFIASELNQWIQDAIDTISLQLEPLVVTSKTNLVADQGEYALPADLISVKQVYLLTNSTDWVNVAETTYERLFEINPDWEGATATRTPTHWYWRQDTLGLYPEPSTAVTAGLRILYTYRPAAMTGDSSTSGLPDWFDRALVMHVLYRCRLKDRDEPRAGAALSEFTKLVAEGGTRINKQRKQHAPRLQPNMQTYRGYYARTRSGPRLTTTGT